jgi:hypothetical protein
MESTEWLELLRPFTCVKDLVLSKKFVPFVALALQDLDGERVTQMLPMLQYLFFEGSQPSGAAKKAMEKFIAARQFSGYPVTMNALEVGGFRPRPMTEFYDMNEVFGNTTGDFSFDADALGDMNLFFDPSAVHDGSSLDIK